MEEILASIRRIISEEEQAPAAAPVIDLTQTDKASRRTQDDPVFEAPEPPASVVAQAAPQPVARVRTSAPGEATMVSGPTTHAAAGALARLAGSLRISETPNQTVEGVVRELLQPLLKDWLDHNLPAIVEAKVEAELERIARLAR